MYVKMLEAISEMLALPDDQKDLDAYKQVWCAKLMLDKIIEGMQEPKAELTTWASTSNSTKVEMSKLKAEEPKRTGKEPEVEYDHVKKIFTRVDNVPEDGMIELNGYRVRATAIVGKTLTDIPKIGTKL